MKTDFVHSQAGQLAERKAKTRRIAIGIENSRRV
jgi:hypothetical protein